MAVHNLFFCSYTRTIKYMMTTSESTYQKMYNTRSLIVHNDNYRIHMSSYIIHDHYWHMMSTSESLCPTVWFKHILFSQLCNTRSLIIKNQITNELALTSVNIIYTITNESLIISYPHHKDDICLLY